MKRIFAPVLFLFILVLVTALFLNSPVSSEAAAPLMLQSGTAASSLVGEWRFDEATGTSAADSSGRSLNGTLQNGSVWTSGRYRAGLQFDGVNDYVQVGAQPALVMTNAMSISAWIYPTGPGSAGPGIIVNKEGEYEVARFSDGTIRWAFANSSPGWNFIDTGFVAPLNQWTHIALTYNNGQVKTYANGNLVHSYLGSGSIGDVATSHNDFRIGGRQYVDQTFMGVIDEVSIYNQALAATDVSTLSQGSMLRNLALRKPATQSSTGWDSPASLAVDGNTNGDWFQGSVSHTNDNAQAWWQVDLGSVQQIDNVSVFMMTVCCSSHDNFDVKVSSDGISWTSYYVAGPVDQVTAPFNRTARYVRVQLRGSGYLALAEVQVWGVSGAVMPGVVQAEDFDDGGEGIAYHDFTTANEGGLYRNTAVDISSCSINNYVIGWNGSGEWTQYSINVLNSGSYTFQAVIGQESATGSLHVEIDGVDRSGPINIPATGSYCAYQTISKDKISLSAGQHTMRVVTDNAGVVLDSFRLVADSTPLTMPNAAAFISQSVPTSMTPGQVYNVSVTMQNTGSNTWTTAGSYNLGTQNPQDNSIWNVTRVALPNSQSVSPGQQVTFAFPIKAPATVGTYNFQMRMVQDGVAWFGALTSNLIVTVATPNQSPNARVGGTPAAGVVGNPFQFSSEGSSDPDGTITSYSWNFGDGQTASGANPTHTYSYGGNYTVSLTVTDNAGATATATMTVAVIETTQSSYLNNSQVPGTIQAEDFDNGGLEVAYHDDSIGNLGGSGTYRPGEYVDIENNTATSGGYAVGWARAGEWLNYVVQVPDTDNYNFEARVASPIDGGTGGVFHLEIDGSNKTGPITIPNTGGAWTTVSKSGLKLTTGRHVLRLVMDSGGSTGYVGRFDYFKFTATQSPYGGTARSLPGTIQAEDFDNGDPGAAYSDTTTGNQGGAYRITDVDIWNSSEGPAVGWGQKGEWLDYTVNVSQNDTYTFAVRVASPGTGAKFHLEIDEFAATMPIAIPATGSRDAWQTIQMPIKLTTGRHIFRLVVDELGASSEVCFNSVTFSIPPKDPTKPPVEALLGNPEIYNNFDYVALGVRNLVNPSNKGEFALRNISNVRHAFLFWWGVPNGILQPGRIKFNGKEEFGTPIAPASQGDILAGIESASYRLDVTSTVARLGNVNYTIETQVTFGASLIVLYDDGIANNNRDITLFAGNDGNKFYRRPIDGFVEPEGWDATLRDINYSGGIATVQLHVAEGQRQPETPLVFSNGARSISYPRPTDPFDFFGPDLFQGDSVPPFNLPEGGMGLWDIRNFDITSIVSSGQNTVKITAGRLTDTLFLVLAVVNLPHPVPTVTITDPRTDNNVRVSGSLNGTLQKSLLGGRIELDAQGSTSGDNYQWTFTGPVQFIENANTRRVRFETKDDRVRPTDPLKQVYRITAKVVFTNNAGVKSEASVNIDAHVPTLPFYEGRPSASIVEEDQESLIENTVIIWQMGSSDPNNRQPAMTFTARAQIPDGRYLSNLDESHITFQQAINVNRKIRNSWGKESCKTTRSLQDTPENIIRSGWRHDDDTFPNRVSQFSGATKRFDESVASANSSRSLTINFQEGIEGIKFGNKRSGFNHGFPHALGLGTDLIDIDAASVDDRYETYVMYSSGSFSYPIGTVSWRWGGTLVFDTTWQEVLPPPDPAYSHLPPTNPVSEYYRVLNNTTTSRPVQHAATDTVVAGSVLDPQFKWGQCLPGFGKPQPTGDFHTIVENQHGFVQLLYREALGRSPFDADFFPPFPSGDRIGYHFWASHMTRNGFMDGPIAGYRVHVARAFLYSDDLKNLHTDENDPMNGLSSGKHSIEYYKSFVWACYAVLLQRAPGTRGRTPHGDQPGDMSGYNFWVEKLAREDGMRTNDDDDQAFFETVSAFLSSVEYTERIRTDPNLNDFIDDIREAFDNPAPRFNGPLQ